MKSGAIVFLVLAAAVFTGYSVWEKYANRASQESYATLSAALPPETSPLITPAAPSPASSKTYKFPGVLPKSETENKVAVIKTAQGEIRFEILAGEGPKAASNFIYLAKEGYYNGLNFHRVESWVIQSGDPNCTKERLSGRCGTGGPGYKFADEPVRLPYKTGIVAMANAGPNTNGSQFFIMKQEVPLGPNYTIFGRIISGIDVVQKIAPGDTIEKVEIKDE